MVAARPRRAMPEHPAQTVLVTLRHPAQTRAASLSIVPDIRTMLAC
jgi:hypothetical protein